MKNVTHSSILHYENKRGERVEIQLEMNADQIVKAIYPRATRNKGKSATALKGGIRLTVKPSRISA